MLPSRPKRFVDCSVQTDFCDEMKVAHIEHARRIARGADAISESSGESWGSNNSLGELQPIPTMENSAPSGTPICKDACNHTHASKAGVDALVPRHHSRQERTMLSTIGYGRPSAVVFSATRIYSLPDNTATTGQILGRIEKQIRLASMPERGKFGTLQLSQRSEDIPADSSYSTDITYYSMEPVQKLVRRNCEAERAYPTDLPQTPSPPSSPDSVMIIANEEQLSGSFLRRQSVDESGWITWASSPPRPIPALHGPSSLPYARCPSGAEGTLVEGDDLSHKIWGLGIDDTQGSGSRSNHLNSKTHGPISQTGQQQNYHDDSRSLQPSNHEGTDRIRPSFPHERDAIIDLSRPLIFGNIDGSAGFLHKSAPHFVQQARNTRLEILPGGESSGPYSATHISHNSKLPINAMRKNALTSTSGLGLNWNAFAPPEASASRKNDAGNRLNSAAPVFIPAGGVVERPQVPCIRHASNAEPAISVQQNKKPTFNMASQYRTQQDYHLPTPPSTASPHWSPIFSQPLESGLSRKVAVKSHVQRSHMHPVPKIYSPQADSEGYPFRLSAAVAEQFSGHSPDHDVQRYSPAPQVELPILRIRSAKAIGHVQPSASGLIENCLDNHQHDTEPPNEMTDINDLLFSSERRRNLSYQHPRSIPLARLIQRRLSSVAEEDAGRESLLPMLRKKVSELAFNRLSKRPSSLKSNGWKPEFTSSYEHFEYTMGDEDIVESAVSVEDPPMSVENPSAIVKLPQKAAAPRSSQGPDGFAPRVKGDGGKENDNNDGLVHGKLKNKHRKKDLLRL